MNKGAIVELNSRDLKGNWKGKVVRISEIIDPNTQTVKVYVQVSGKGLREGMYLDARIAGTQITQAVEIPRKLLDDGNHIFVLQDSILKLHKVTTIKYTTDAVVVKGLPNGTQMINENVIGAFEGMKAIGY